MKDLQYITHDLGARNDPKLIELQMAMGGQGLGIYWCLVEMLWEQDGRLPLNPRTIAFSLRWASPEEVERVIKGFGLFKDDGKVFWSESALARIAKKNDKIRAQKAGGRKGAEKRWNGLPNGLPMGDPMPINKLTNKQTNKQTNSNNTPLTAADLFEIFFMLNFKDPSGEAGRFLEYYKEREWKYQDGTPITDQEKAARDWKPAKAGKRFDTDALNWYKAVWNCYKARNPERPEVEGFLADLTAMRRKGQDLALVYKSRDTARTVAGFITENDLAGDWNIDFRVDN